MGTGLPGAAGAGSAKLVRLAVFRSGSVRCAVPVVCVERVLPMMAVSPLPSAPRVVIGILSLHGRPVPVVDLRRRLDLPEREYGPDAHLVVLQTPLRRLAIAADEALGLTEVEEGLVASAASLMAGGGPITGAISVGREMLLIHDVEAFLSEDEHGQIVEALRSS